MIFLKLDPNNNLSITLIKFFLSLGILTDLTYLDLLMREKLPIINSNYNFLNIFYSIDRSLIKIFGLESFWIFNIFYKLISFLILYFGFNKLFNFKKENLIIFSICLAIFFCIDIQPFNDRWPRPQLTNIFAFFVIVNNLKYLNNIEVSNFSNFFYGLSHAITAFTVPWFSAIILSLSAFTFFLKNKNKAKLFIILGFLIFLPNIIIYL